MPRFTITCPHCSSQIEIDGEAQLVASCTPPHKPRSTTSIEERLEALEKEKRDARDKMAEAFRSEQSGARLREEKFRKLLETARDEPVTKPIRDIDLD